jgi:hypothetical protein
MQDKLMNRQVLCADARMDAGHRHIQAMDAFVAARTRDVE